MTNTVWLRTTGAIIFAAFLASITVASQVAYAEANAGTPVLLFERSIHGTYESNVDRPHAGDKPIEAVASAAGRGGYIVRRFRARYRALAKWRIAAAGSYGPGATRWTLARNKTVDCKSHAVRVTCSVSALPATPLQRLGL